MRSCGALLCNMGRAVLRRRPLKCGRRSYPCLHFLLQTSSARRHRRYISAGRRRASANLSLNSASHAAMSANGTLTPGTAYPWAGRLRLFSRRLAFAARRTINTNKKKHYRDQETTSTIYTYCFPSRISMDGTLQALAGIRRGRILSTFDCQHSGQPARFFAAMRLTKC